MKEIQKLAVIHGNAIIKNNVIYLPEAINDLEDPFEETIASAKTKQKKLELLKG